MRKLDTATDGSTLPPVTQPIFIGLLAVARHPDLVSAGLPEADTRATVRSVLPAKNRQIGSDLKSCAPGLFADGSVRELLRFDEPSDVVDGARAAGRDVCIGRALAHVTTFIVSPAKKSRRASRELSMSQMGEIDAIGLIVTGARPRRMPC
jgi:hypothetical protein